MVDVLDLKTLTVVSWFRFRGYFGGFGEQRVGEGTMSARDKWRERGEVTLNC